MSTNLLGKYQLSESNEQLTVGTEAYQPTEDEEYMNPKQLEYFKGLLLNWKKGVEAKMDKEIENLQQKSWYVPDLSDSAAIETVTSVVLRDRDRLCKLLSRIDAALVRIKNGEYGYCSDTGEKIGLKILIARPIAALAIESQDRSKRRMLQHESYQDDDYESNYQDGID